MRGAVACLLAYGLRKGILATWVVAWALPVATLLAQGDFSLVSYNVLGRDQADWTTNAAQVQAIGRQLAWLQPDIVGFQEIPETNANYQHMAAFVSVYLPGYHLATGQRTDGGERTVIASRFPISRSQSWLARSDLRPFGFEGVFTRDLFEAEIVVPGLPQPLHVFNTHLKAHGDETSALRRAAEARAISNFLVTAFLPTRFLRPYVLLGDLNEDAFRPRPFEQGAIGTLTSAPTGLQLRTPRHPVTGDDRTWSIRNEQLSIRFDYILPSSLLSTNLVASLVFRSDQVAPLIPPLLASDSATAADHLPVMMRFRDPFRGPLRVLGLTWDNGMATLRWATVPGDRCRVERSTDLAVWQPVVTNLIGATGQGSYQTATEGAARFFRVARHR